MKKISGSAAAQSPNQRRHLSVKWPPVQGKLDKPSYDELLAILKEAAEHLDYCGYGDKWERDCAKASKLQERIEDIIHRASPVPNANNDSTLTP